VIGYQALFQDERIRLVRRIGLRHGSLRTPGLETLRRALKSSSPPCGPRPRPCSARDPREREGFDQSGLRRNIGRSRAGDRTLDNIRAARTRPRAELNAGTVTVSWKDVITDAFLASAGADAPQFTDEDCGSIASLLDLSASTFYTANTSVRSRRAGLRGHSILKSHPRMASSWQFFGPEALYWAPRTFRKSGT